MRRWVAWFVGRLGIAYSRLKWGGWLIVWLLGGGGGWLLGRLVGGFVGCFLGWVGGCLLGRLAASWVSWLVGCVVPAYNAILVHLLG